MARLLVQDQHFFVLKVAVAVVAEDAALTAARMATSTGAVVFVALLLAHAADRSVGRVVSHLLAHKRSAASVYCNYHNKYELP